MNFGCSSDDHRPDQNRQPPLLRKEFRVSTFLFLFSFPFFFSLSSSFSRDAEGRGSCRHRMPCSGPLEEESSLGSRRWRGELVGEEGGEELSAGEERQGRLFALRRKEDGVADLEGEVVTGLALHDEPPLAHQRAPLPVARAERLENEGEALVGKVCSVIPIRRGGIAPGGGLALDHRHQLPRQRGTIGGGGGEGFGKSGGGRLAHAGWPEMR